MKICGKDRNSRKTKLELLVKTYQLKDHSNFVAFAPEIIQKLLLAVFIENSGYGATWAGQLPH